MGKGSRGGFPGGRGGMGGMGGMGGGNMNQLMQQAQRMQRDMEKAQEEIAALTVESTAGGGAVKVVVNGLRQIRELTIQPAVVDPADVEMLQDLIMIAVNDALTKVGEQSEARMAQVTGGKGLPLGF